MQRGEQYFIHGLRKAGNTLRKKTLKLLSIEAWLNEVEEHLQEQILVDLFRGNWTHVNTLTNELTVIRKVCRILRDLKVIFETLSQRMDALNDYNESYNALKSTVRSLNDVKQDLRKNMPTAKLVFTNLSNTLSGTLSELNIEKEISEKIVTDTILEILEEVIRVLEVRMEKIPTLSRIRQEKIMLVNE